MWRERNCNQEHPNYRRMDDVYQRHHARFATYVTAHGLPCQSCGGAGGWTDVICEGQGPWEECGWCEGTGKVTRWLRGLWLRWRRDEKRKAKQRAAEKRGRRTAA